MSSRALSSEDQFILLACDGVWDVMSDQQACSCVLEHLKADPSHTPQTAAAALVNASFEAGSLDNISVAIGVFHHFGITYHTNATSEEDNTTGENAAVW